MDEVKMRGSTWIKKDDVQAYLEEKGSFTFTLDEIQRIVSDIVNTYIYEKDRCLSKEILKAIDKEGYVVVKKDTSDIVCPFCHTDNFDLSRLKYHLRIGCNAMEETIDICESG